MRIPNKIIESEKLLVKNTHGQGLFGLHGNEGIEFSGKWHIEINQLEIENQYNVRISGSDGMIYNDWYKMELSDTINHGIHHLKGFSSDEGFRLNIIVGTEYSGNKGEIKEFHFAIERDGKSIYNTLSSLNPLRGSLQIFD